MTTETFVPSKYQQAIFEEVESGEGNIMVGAVAGSGKTKTLLESLSRMGGKVLFCAFNKSIASELASRVPQHVEARTIHSLGLDAVRRGLFAGRRAPQDWVDGKKVEYIISDIFEEREQKVSWEARRSLERLIGLMKTNLVKADDRKAIVDLIEWHGIELSTDEKDNRILDAIPDILTRDQEEAEHCIDFDDMVWLPHVLDLSPRTFDWVCIDECQDLNAAQRDVVLKAVKSTGRILAVGDKNQAIYGFAGADVRSWEILIDRLQAKVLPLSICYRCPSSHLDLAREIVPQIEPRESAPEGIVGYLNNEQLLEKAEDGDMVLCRTNAPLVDVCLALIRNQKKATIRGRDIGRNLLGIVKKRKRGCNSLKDLVEKLHEYLRKETAKLLKAKKEAQAESLKDRIETLFYLTDGIESIRGLEHRIESIFSDKVEGIVCSSVHKAKGLETDRVIIIRPELLPFPFAKEEWQIAQEFNLKYVALTRAKKELIFVS